jgi:hypothetical protein
MTMVLDCQQFSNATTAAQGSQWLDAVAAPIHQYLLPFGITIEHYGPDCL